MQELLLFVVKWKSPSKETCEISAVQEKFRTAANDGLRYNKAKNLTRYPLLVNKAASLKQTFVKSLQNGRFERFLITWPILSGFTLSKVVGRRNLKTTRRSIHPFAVSKVLLKQSLTMYRLCAQIFAYYSS